MDPIKPVVEAAGIGSVAVFADMVLDVNGLLIAGISLVPVVIYRVGVIAMKWRKQSQDDEIERLKDIVHNSNCRMKDAFNRANAAEDELRRLREKMAHGEAE